MRSLRWGVAVVFIGCGGPSDEVAAQSGRLVGASLDTSSPEHDTVVRVRANLTQCTGTLIAPLVVLTARHCLVNASPQNTQVVIGANVTSGVVVDVGGFFVQSETSIDPQTGYAGDASDYALVVLSATALNRDAGSPRVTGPAWTKLLELKVDRPSFGASPTVTNHEIAGYDDLLDRALIGPSMNNWQTLQQQFGLWIGRSDSNSVIENGDSGGPLFVTQPDGFRDVAGVVVGFRNTPTPKESLFVDIAFPEVHTFIADRARDPRHDNQPNWISGHQASVDGQGRPTRWYGEVDYTGLCKKKEDFDCDHWYDEHDNCQSVFNPDQIDANDDGLGDACTPGVCECATEPDVDKDGICSQACPGRDRDNCQRAYNPSQANCNRLSELARNAAQRGDACDPVPCPDSVADEPGTEILTCDTPQPDAGCTLSTLYETLSTRAIGSHRSESVVSGTRLAGDPRLNDVPVPNVVTEARYCNYQLPNVDCLDPANIDDVLLNVAETPGGAWHKTSLGLVPNLLPPQPLPPGTAWALNYDGNTTGRFWGIRTDFSRWFLNGPAQIPAPPLCNPLTPTGIFGCLGDGVVWTHANTTVGSQAIGGDRVGTVVVGIHADKLANGYSIVTPASSVRFCFAPLPITFRLASISSTTPSLAALSSRSNVLVVRDAPFSQANQNAQGSAEFVFQDDTGTAVTAMNNGTLVSMNGANNPNCGPPRLSPDGVTSFASGVWANSVEPWATTAALIAPDGTAVAALLERGTDGLSLQSLPTPNSGPAPRSDFVSFYSQALGGAVVAGGHALGGGTLHDVWFAGAGSRFVEVTPTNVALGEVLAASFSPADGRVWILDAPTRNTAVGAVRLSRFDIETRTASILASWPRIRTTIAYGLTPDVDDGVLLSASGNQVSATVRIRATSTPAVTRVHLEPFGLLRPPAVDRHGYAFLARTSAGQLRVVRRASLGGLAVSFGALQGWF